MRHALRTRLFSSLEDIPLGGYTCEIGTFP
jgi:hypothetical protein